MFRIIILMLAVTCIVTGVQLPVIEQELNQWNAENACINSLVKSGVERSNIMRNHGTCYGILRAKG